MKYQYTTIIGVNSTASHVEILYYPEGADSAYPPVQMYISPHQNHVNIHFSSIAGKVVKPMQNCACANCLDILLNDNIN